ncbi:acyl carrier protein [Streptomyces sp. NPDC046853]|uniref:acyl carrier protein n=1 Tax=Streptomyces sp. NPDC046853 TaxID=3154920 RepID=UPI0033E7E4EB
MNDLSPARAEAIAARAWCETLEIARTAAPDRTENFFAAGGTSVLLAQLQHRLTTGYGFRFAARDIFASPTIAGIAACALRRSREDAP